ncbi:MAG: ABC transporter permease [Marinilabiliaceae bacterium]|nr:ABC transporter permease [Marinilabiliaceae bacterium]
MAFTIASPTTKLNAMLSLRLAFRNLMGAGLRTWLNVFVLSVAFVVIVFYNGMLDGWNQQAKADTRAWETGSGQLWHAQYNPFDSYCLEVAHALLPPAYEQSIDEGDITPVLITQATAYRDNRMQNILLKGIAPEQIVMKLPTHLLDDAHEEMPHVLIGKRMAAASHLTVHDTLLIRWRDRHGTFDACQVIVAGIFGSNVPTIDNGQMWMNLNRLQQMTGLSGHATLMIAGPGYQHTPQPGWIFKDDTELLKEFSDIIRAKKWSSSVIYGLLLAIALLAIFDTQVLSIFRRQKEIGTYIALGLTRGHVVGLFTLEGSAQSLLAIIVGTLWGLPLLWALHVNGIAMPGAADEMGLTIGEKIVPVYSFAMVAASIVLVTVSATLVSYLPTRKILHLHPTDALKGKLI